MFCDKSAPVSLIV